MEAGKIWSEVKRLDADRTGGGASRMTYGPEGATGSDDDVTQPDTGYVGQLTLQRRAVMLNTSRIS
jgi:hypothetical protein